MYLRICHDLNFTFSNRINMNLRLRRGLLNIYEFINLRDGRILYLKCTYEVKIISKLKAYFAPSLRLYFYRYNYWRTLKCFHALQYYQIQRKNKHKIHLHNSHRCITIIIAYFRYIWGNFKSVIKCIYA